jgi:hypothetical protein
MREGSTHPEHGRQSRSDGVEGGEASRRLCIDRDDGLDRPTRRWPFGGKIAAEASDLRHEPRIAKLFDSAEPGHLGGRM